MNEEELNALFRRVFGTAEGEAVLLDLATKCQLNRVQEIGTPSDHLQYIEGARSMYAYICQRALMPRT